MNYNPSGVQLLYHVVYARFGEAKKFASFCGRYQKHLEEYAFPYEIVEGLEEVEDDATAFMRHMRVTLDMGGKPARVHFFVARVN